MRQRGLKIGSIAYKILLEIDSILWEMSSLPRKMTQYTGMRFLGDYSQLPKYIYDLKRRGYIQEIGKKGKKRIQLTSKGELEIIKYKIKSKTQKTKWDGKWRAISWDVPERSRKDRDYLRGKLRWLGFKELQKSFWVFPFEIKNEIEELTRLYKEELAGDVRFLTIEKIEDDSDLKEYFDL
ncbi:MAG: hypothetical protein Q8N56_02435 [bacterium]|nr:hypothetical protein [bacterium]